MTHYQDPRERWYTQPACGARPIWTGGTWCDPISPNITCKACQSVLAHSAFGHAEAARAEAE